MANAATNAFLVRLQISQWSPRKLDRTASKEAKERAGAGDKAGVKVYKSVLATEALEKVASIAGAAREEHEKRTVPWQYKGPGAIAAAGYRGYVDAMAKYEQEFRDAVRAFCGAYEEAREDAASNLGNMYNPADYPGLDEIRSRFSFVTICEPMPQSNDFRVNGLGDAEVKAIKGDMDKRFRQTIEDAQADAWERLTDYLEKLRSKVSEYKPKGNGCDKTQGRFHDTLVENLRDLVDMMPSLNITGDKALEQVAAKVKARVCGHAPQELREHEHVRKAVVKEVDAVIEEVQQIWAGRSPVLN